MRVPSVETFLCCIKLERGATLLGWFGGITAAFLFSIFLLTFGFVAVDFKSFLNVTEVLIARADTPVNNPFSQIGKFN